MKLNNSLNKYKKEILFLKDKIFKYLMMMIKLNIQELPCNMKNFRNNQKTIYLLDLKQHQLQIQMDQIFLKKKLAKCVEVDFILILKLLLNNKRKLVQRKRNLIQRFLDKNYLSNNTFMKRLYDNHLSFKKKNQMTIYLKRNLERLKLIANILKQKVIQNFILKM